MGQWLRQEYKSDKAMTRHGSRGGSGAKPLSLAIIKGLCQE